MILAHAGAEIAPRPPGDDCRHGLWDDRRPFASDGWRSGLLERPVASGRDHRRRHDRPLGCARLCEWTRGERQEWAAPSGSRGGAIARREASILLASILPIAAIALGALGAVPGRTALWIAFALGVAALTVQAVRDAYLERLSPAGAARGRPQSRLRPHLCGTQGVPSALGTDTTTSCAEPSSA
jgi:hypothetical protein